MQIFYGDEIQPLETCTGKFKTDNNRSLNKPELSLGWFLIYQATDEFHSCTETISPTNQGSIGKGLYTLLLIEPTWFSIQYSTNLWVEIIGVPRTSTNFK